MSESKRSFEFSMQTNSNEIADYLEGLAGHLRAGTVQLSAGSQSIDLRIGSVMKMEIEAESRPRKGKSSLQLELSWREPMTISTSIT
jgi:amphi-Trp domain-containing protein